MSVTKTMTQLRSPCHQILANEIDKVAVSSFDDKRFILDNGISSLAFGHHRITFESGQVIESMFFLKNLTSSFCDKPFL